MLTLNKDYPKSVFPHIWKATFGSIISSKVKLLWLVFLAISTRSTIQQRYKPEKLVHCQLHLSVPLWKTSKQFFMVALASGYQWGWKVAVHSKVLALVEFWLFNQRLSETGREGRQSCSEVWCGLHTRRGLHTSRDSSVCVYIYLHT